MPSLRSHLRISQEFLGLKGNPAVHRLLDIGGPHTHRLTHNPRYIELIIRKELGEEGELEAWGHLLADWGLIEARPARKSRKKK